MDGACVTPGDLCCFLQRLQTEPAVLVRVGATQGSAPREAGAWLAVFAEGACGTIGGGQLEWRVTQQARELLSDPGWQHGTQRHALGPSLGQCCGGVMQLDLRRVSAADLPGLHDTLHPVRWPVALFGGGHVGAAIVQALAPLPFAVRWVDSRDGIFPAGLPPHVQTEHSEPVERAVADLSPGSQVLIMSFSHAEDLAVLAACLLRRRQRHDLPFIGLIGSRSKWATFRHRLLDRGYSAEELDQVHCPIGLPGIQGKQPAVIAASVAAQLLLFATPDSVEESTLR
ncbi:MAG TPA: xanthine dehydrogenase accessory protein XdhC [Macromonas sp.]|nr:xanthine dehydrogenase accessory protein XdhC [Macromonas sp.]